jgi:hypothetical protein
VGRIPLVRDFGIDPAAKWLVSYKERYGHLHVVSSFESFVRVISTETGIHRKLIFLQTFGQFYEKAVILDEPQKVRGAFIFFGFLEDWKIVFNELTERECVLEAEVSETPLSVDIVLAVASNTNLQRPATFPIKELLNFASYYPETGRREPAG